MIVQKQNVVIGLEPERALLLEDWGAFVLVPFEGGRTRFIIRSRMSHPQIPVWTSALEFMTFELPHFIMQRRMMLTIKELAERGPKTTLTVYNRASIVDRQGR